MTQRSQFNLRNPDIDIDSNGRVWVVYEDNSWGPTEIVVSVRDTVGWNPKVRVTNSPSRKANPAIQVDTINNVHVVWEDDRNGHFQIFWDEWQDDNKAWVSSGQFGEDTPVMQYHANDPYQEGAPIDFKNPALEIFGDKLWLVAEAHFRDTNTSAIYRGYRDLIAGMWISSGAVITDESDEIPFCSKDIYYTRNQHELLSINSIISIS